MPVHSATSEVWMRRACLGIACFSMLVVACDGPSTADGGDAALRDSGTDARTPLRDAGRDSGLEMDALVLPDSGTDGGPAPMDAGTDGGPIVDAGPDGAPILDA